MKLVPRELHNPPSATEPTWRRDSRSVRYHCFSYSAQPLGRRHGDGGRARGGNHAEQADDFWIERQGWGGKRRFEQIWEDNGTQKGQGVTPGWGRREHMDGNGVAQGQNEGPRCLPPTCSKDATHGKLRPINRSPRVGKALYLHSSPFNTAVLLKATTLPHPSQSLKQLRLFQIARPRFTLHRSVIACLELNITQLYLMVNRNFLKIKSLLAIGVHLWSIVIILFHSPGEVGVVVSI